MHISKTIVTAILVVLALLLVACGGSDPTATPAPESSEATPPPPPAPEIVDPWQRIQETGKMVIGTSADYPPFESYDAKYEIVGFDPALIEVIARNLGVEVELQDIAFDGLGGALQVGQIDAAIAAISVTDQREEQVDFSNIYYVSDDAILASEGSSMESLQALNDLDVLRVGVQRGSVYEDLLEDELVDTGEMPATSLHSYGDVESAVDDLREGLLDAVMLDLLPAKEFELAGGVKIVAEGLNREKYAIAFAKGTTEFQSEVNRVLVQLLDAGIVDDLAEEYLDLEAEDVAPIPTATPTPAAATATPSSQRPVVPGCIDSMKWVQDLSYDDNNMTAPPLVQPGQAFRKGWRVLNNGTCTWNSSYVLKFVQGNSAGARMGGRPTAIAGTVAPGATYDLYVDLVAPINAGIYQGTWNLTNGQGTAFGERLWVGITVPSGVVVTAVPTQTPSPNIGFSVDRTSIKSGECVTFSWNVTNVREVYFYAEGENWQNNGVPGQSSRQECPTQTTTYYLRVVNQDGTVETRQIRIDVQQVAGAPNIEQYSVEPAGQIAVGQCVTVRWDVQGDVSRVNLFRNDTAIWNNAPFRGSSQDCPPGVGNYDYRIEASGSGGTSKANNHVDVVESNPATPTPTATATGVPLPVITGFTANPMQIAAGACVNLAWSTTNAEFTQLARDGSIIQDGGPVNTTLAQDCPPGNGQIKYTLTAFNHERQSTSSDVTVAVDAPVEPTPEPTKPAPTETSTPAVIEPTATWTPEPPTVEPPTATPEPPTPEPPTATPEPPPVINSFTAAPSEIALGACVDLAWDFSGTSLALAQVTRNGAVIVPDAVSPGAFQNCISDAALVGVVAYQLKVDSEFSGSATADQQVTVIQAVAAPSN